MQELVDELLEMLKQKNELIDAYLSLNKDNMQIREKMESYISLLKKENEWLKSIIDEQSMWFADQ